MGLLTPKFEVSQPEMQVLNLLSNGYSIKEAASTLYISTITIKAHRKSLFKKLKAKNVIQLVRKGFGLGLIT